MDRVAMLQFQVMTRLELWQAQAHADRAVDRDRRLGKWFGTRWREQWWWKR